MNMACFNRLPLRWPEIILCLSLIIVTVLHIPLSVFPMGRDQGVWATAGMAINEGAVFFKDYLHFNLPGLGFSYALAFQFVDDPGTAGMLVNLAGSLLMILGMYLLLKETVSKSAAAWSVIIFSILWPVTIGFWDIAQKDFMAMYGVLIGTGLMARAENTSHLRRLCIYGGGFFIGLSMMYKPIFAIAGIMLAALHTGKFLLAKKHADEKSLAYLITDLLVLLAGPVTIALVFISYLFVGDGITNAYKGIFHFARAYSMLTEASWQELTGILIFRSWLLGNPINWYALLPALLWPVLLGAGVYSFFIKGSIKSSLFFVPFLTSLFTYFIQGKGFVYHAAPWQICIIMIAGSGLAWAWGKNKNTGKQKLSSDLLLPCILTVILGVVFFRAMFMTRYINVDVPAWSGSLDRDIYLENHFRISDSIPLPSENERLAAWIKTNSQDDDLILVWGLECQIYVLSDRLYATNAPFDVILSSLSLEGSKAEKWQMEMREQFIVSLREQQPKFIVIVSNNANFMTPLPSNESVALVPGFQSLLDRHYTKVKTLGLFDVYQYAGD